MSFFDTAIKQSARDVGCKPEDFFKAENTVNISTRRDGAKSFYPEIQDFLLIRYGRFSAVSVREDKYPAVSAYFAENEYISPSDWSSLGFVPKFETMWFLPAKDCVEPLPCRYETRLLTPEDFKDLYIDDWSNALSKKRPHLDKMAIGAFDGEKLIGLAGCSADCDEMYQIGVDVLPKYRRQGIAASITSKLTAEIIKIGKTPFYSCWWTNIPSVKNAIKSGFTPVWTEIQASLV